MKSKEGKTNKNNSQNTLKFTENKEKKTKKYLAIDNSIKSIFFLHKSNISSNFLFGVRSLEHGALNTEHYMHDLQHAKKKQS